MTVASVRSASETDGWNGHRHSGTAASESASGTAARRCSCWQREQVRHQKSVSRRMDVRFACMGQPYHASIRGGPRARGRGEGEHQPAYTEVEGLAAGGGTRMCWGTGKGRDAGERAGRVQMGGARAQARYTGAPLRHRQQARRTRSEVEATASRQGGEKKGRVTREAYRRADTPGGMPAGRYASRATRRRGLWPAL